MKKSTHIKGENTGTDSPIGGSKLLGRKEKKQNQAALSDIGLTNIDSVSIQGGDPKDDSFERYYNKDLDLDEGNSELFVKFNVCEIDQVPVVIYELNESAINFISQESYEKALILLQKAQSMLDQIQADQNPKDQFIFLLTLHNMAMCYQKLGILEECAICLEACLVNLSSNYMQQFFNDPKIPSLRLKMLKYKCKTHMQICALLSQVHKHKEAVFHAKEGIKLAHFLIKDLTLMVSLYNTEILQRKPLKEISIINNNRFSLLEKTAVKLLPIFKSLIKKMAYEEMIPQQPQLQTKDSFLTTGGSSCINNEQDVDMKNILGYLNQSEWIYSLNIGNIMQIAPLTLQDFIEYWHGKAVEIAITFLPSESPLVSHILMSYEKHHSPSIQAIPEDEQQDVQVKVVRQTRGVESNKLQPIIRHHQDKDFKAPKVDIEYMNYQSFLFEDEQNSKKNQKTTPQVAVIEQSELLSDYNEDQEEDMEELEMIDEEEEQCRELQLKMQNNKAKSHEESLSNNQNIPQKTLYKQGTNEIDMLPNDGDQEMDNSVIVSDNDQLVQQQPHYHSVIEETLAFNMGTLDSRENGVSNKNTRKLKKNEVYPGINNMRLEENEAIDGRRAKSSLGDQSAGRRQNKGAQGSKNDINTAKINVINQLRGNSSSAMSRLHNPQQHQPLQNSLPTNLMRNITSQSSGNDLQQIQKPKSQLENIQTGESPNDRSLVRIQRHLQGSSGNTIPKRRFKNNNVFVQDINQSIEQSGVNTNPTSVSQRPRNEVQRLNSSSKDRSANNKRHAPITDIRAKKQNSTINTDDLPIGTPSLSKKFVDVNNTIIIGSQSNNQRNNRGRDLSQNDETATSLERDLQLQKMNQSYINNTSLNNSIQVGSTGKRSAKPTGQKSKSKEGKSNLKMMIQQQQIISMIGNQASADGILQMIKKREKLNNSALGTTTNNAQIYSHLNTQKRTPTAGGNMQTQSLMQQPQMNKNKQGSTKKTKDKLKFAAFTQDNWNSWGIDVQKLAQAEVMKRAGLKSGSKNKSNENSNNKQGSIFQGYGNISSAQEDDLASKQFRISAPAFIQSQTQYEGWVQYQAQKQIRKPQSPDLLAVMIREARSYRNPEEQHDIYTKMVPEERALDLLDSEDQLDFIRKVYGILFTQVFLTAIVTLVAYVSLRFQLWLLAHPGLLFFCAITCIILSCCMYCVPPLTRTVPLNYILLTTFTICEALLVAYLCVKVNNPRAVLTAAVMTAGIVLALTIYAVTTTRDYTTMGALAFVFGAIFIMVGLFSWMFGPKLYMIYCALGVLLFGFYLVFDTQLILGNGKYLLDRDDYILGSMILYLDILNIFLYLLQFLTGGKE